MSRPVVGVIATGFQINDRIPVQMAGEKNLRAIAEVAGATPLMFPGLPDVTRVADILDVVDGVLLTGGRANVHPRNYDEPPDVRHEPFDECRDAVALEISRAAVATGVPIFGVCRGIQEMNVAFGGALHPEVRDLPGIMNHRAPRTPDGEIHPDPEVVFKDRHDVDLIPDGAFAKLLGTTKIRVNSLHGQAITRPGDRIVVEGLSEDGVVEAIRVEGAPAFALGVQWHAEYDPQTNPINQALFQAFGKAVAARRSAR